MIIVDPQSGTQVWGQGYKNLKSVFWGEMFSWNVTNYINYLKDNLLVKNLKSGAVGERRTPTPLLKLVPETSTSTNSVTTAY